jgi:DNA-binding HxlR family transcriptional regulator
MPPTAQTSKLASADEASPQDPPPAKVSAGGEPATAAGGAGSNELCPYFHQAVELVGKRWTGAIVGVLLPGPRRFSEISQGIPQISDRLLSMRLRELEAEGLVERQVFEGYPVRVEYALTAKGHALEPALAQLRTWACEWLKSP